MASDGTLEEYKALRDEIVSMTNRRIQRLTITWTALAAMITASALTKTPEIAALALVFVSSAWKEELSIIRQICGVGGYIEKCIEPHFDGLNWETITSIRMGGPDKRPFGRRLWLTIKSNYGIAGAISLLTTLSLVLQYWDSLSQIRLFFLAVIFVLGCSFLIEQILAGCNLENSKLRAREQFKKHVKQRETTVANPAG
ncbi:hypothetical protein [Vibrio hepatarius]|uniref:hypothetical protein n=1 Tax=Vibrio hepatarius TaxID=171383 RepID=UPI003735A950